MMKTTPCHIALSKISFLNMNISAMKAPPKSSFTQMQAQKVAQLCERLKVFHSIAPDGKISFN